tara:strand:- start:10209 stop:10427 length:219 start_codon:yes stop_codon:yes gene_type:complete
MVNTQNMYLESLVITENPNDPTSSGSSATTSEESITLKDYFSFSKELYFVVSLSLKTVKERMYQRRNGILPF